MRLIVAVLLAVTLVACGGSESASDNDVTQPPATATPEPICSTRDGERAFTLLEAFGQEWQDAANLAHSTPRMQLASRIERLQEIRRTVQQQEWPECAALAHGYLIEGMNAAIDGFIAFLSQEPDAVVNRHMDAYRDAIEQFNREAELLR